MANQTKQQNALAAWWHAHRFELIVFITGASILIVEVSAMRVLSPYFGNTNYTFSSVISVILGALSLGYWRGGVYADTRPGMRDFYRIIFQAGISLVVLLFLVIVALPVGGHYFSLRVGPLVWSLILFFPASYLMGKLSPLAIILAKNERPQKGLGHITGAIFFWSTTGSIAGSLATGFLFIPYLGIKAILFANACGILLLGGAGMVSCAEKKERKYAAINMLCALAILTVGYSSTLDGPLTGPIRLKKDGVYEQLEVVDGVYEGKPVRVFSQDLTTAGGIFLDSGKPAFGYSKYYALYNLAGPKAKRALFIGSGIYAMPKQLHAERPDMQIDVVDIEPYLEGIARDYFGLPDTPKIATHIGDGRRFLFDSKTPYDVISSDVYYSFYSIPAHFTTTEFFKLVKSKLTPNGVFFANIIGSAAQRKDSLLFSIIHTMHEVFPNMAVIAVTSPSSTAIQNFTLIGRSDDAPIDARRLSREFRNIPIFAAMPDHVILLQKLPLDKHQVLTDNFAPVEHLVASLIADNVIPALDLTSSASKGGKQRM